jgi:hypothetical protein
MSFLISKKWRKLTTLPQVLLPAGIDAGPSRTRSPEQKTATTTVYLAAFVAATVSDTGLRHGESTSAQDWGEATDLLKPGHRREVQRMRHPPNGSSTVCKGWIVSKSPISTSQGRSTVYYRFGKAWYDFCCVRLTFLPLF